LSAHDRFTPLFGRVLIGLIFLLSGIIKIANWHAMAGLLASKGMPVANVMLAGAILVEVLGSLCLILGVQTRVAAWIMFLYLIPTTLLFHNFWADQGAMRQDMMVHFLKNLAIMGGLLMVAAYGPGKLSLGGGSDEK
jgi:putative oxidoreductase